MTNHHTVGDTVRLKAEFIDPDTELPVDPTAVTFKSKRHPDTTAASTSGTKDAVGLYHADITVPTAGLWHYRVEATGTYAGTDENDFVVDESQFD